MFNIHFVSRILFFALIISFLNIDKTFAFGSVTVTRGGSTTISWVVTNVTTQNPQCSGDFPNTTYPYNTGESPIINTFWINTHNANGSQLFSKVIGNSGASFPQTYVFRCTDKTPGSTALDTTTLIVNDCPAGNYWDNVNNICAPNPSASFTSTPSCTISSGASSCTSPVSWTSANVTNASLTDCGGGLYTTQGPGAITYNTNGGVTVPQGAGGCYQIRQDSSTGTVLATVNSTGTCTAGTAWDGAKCASTLINGTCSSPAAHYTCATGTGDNQNNINGWDTATQWIWNCVGSGGGTNAACSENKPLTVTPSAGLNGNISPATAQTVTSGNTTTFTVTPNSGYTATVGGTCGGTLVGNTYTTNAITANCTVSATFAISTCTAPTTQNISVACDVVTGQTFSSGSVTRSISKDAYPSCTFPSAPYTTFNSTYVSDNCAYTCNNGATNSWPGSCNIFTITPSAVGSGTITPATPQSVTSGNAKTFTVTPSTGYTAVMSGTCGGTLVGNTYTTNAINGNCTVVATFTLGTCPAPTSQNVTVPCDPITGNSVTGLVTRVQYKSVFPGCTFPSLPITNLNSNYVSDTCVYTCTNGALNPTACTVPTVDSVSLSGNNTSSGVINFTCSNTTNYTVTRDGIAVTSGAYNGIVYVNLSSYGSIAGNYQVTCWNGVLSNARTINPYYDPVPLDTDAVMLNASPITTKPGTLSTITWSINNPTSLCDIVALPVCAGGNTCDAIKDAPRIAAANAITTLFSTGTTDANDPYNTTPGVGRSMSGALRSVVTATGTKSLGKKTIKIDYTTDLYLDCHVTTVGKPNPTKKLRIQVTDDNEG